MIKAPPPESVARVTRWGIMAFLAYALWHTSFGAKPPPSPLTPAGKATAHSVEKAPGADCGRQGSPFNDFSAFALPLLPQYSPSLGIEDIRLGTGEGAFCGQKATLTYSYATRSGVMLYSAGTEANPVSVQLGADTVLPGLQEGLLGMKPGGERIITMAAKRAFGSDMDMSKLEGTAGLHTADLRTEAIVAHASLQSLTPAAPASAMKLRLLNPLGYVPADVSNCGKTVYAAVTLWKLDGSKLFSTLDSQPLHYRLGSGTLPFGLEQGLLDLPPDTARTLIIPPAYQKPLDGSDSASELPDFHWPEGETVLAEVLLLSAPPASAPVPVSIPAAPAAAPAGTPSPHPVN